MKMDPILGEGIPISIKTKRQWIKTNEKVPIESGWNLSENWKTFDDIKGCSYPGFCLTENYVCFDFDHTIDENGNLYEDAEAFRNRMLAELGPTYEEMSCSKHGLHFFYRIQQADPQLAGKMIRVPFSGPDSHVEVWIGGSLVRDGKKKDSNRHIVLTGWQTKDSMNEISSVPSMDFFHTLVQENKQAKQEKETISQTSRKSEHVNEPMLATDKIPGIIRNSKSGILFQKLFDKGDTSGYPSSSEAHLALMNMLPFYCFGNINQMIEIFEMSTLYQNMREEKKNRKDYLIHTAQTALASWDGVTYSAKSKHKKSAGKKKKESIWPDANAEGKPVGMTEANLQKLLDILSVKVYQNDMSKELEFDGAIFSNIPNDGMKAANCVTKLRGEAIKRGLRSSRDDLNCTIELIASKHRRSPAQEYLLMAQKAYLDATVNGTAPVDYVKKVFERIHLDPSAVEQDADLCYRFFLHWLVGAARAPFNTLQKGEMYQGIIVLVGSQHVGKTRFLRHLVPDQELRSTGLKVDPNDKDSVWRVVRKWGVELGEFGTTMSAKRVEDLKNFLTADRDIFRKPYGKSHVEYARTTFFYGSTNQKKFLCDETGDRRYWPIILSYIDFDGWDEKESLLMWGQVMTLAFDPADTDHTSKKPGPVKWWPSDEELNALAKFQENHKMETEEEVALRDLLDWNAPEDDWEDLTVTELINNLAENRTGRDLSTVRMGKTLKCISLADPRVHLQRTANSRNWHVPPMRSNLGGDYKPNF